VSAKSIGKTAFLGVAWPREAKPTHPGAAGGIVEQNWAKSLPREAGWSKAEFKSGRQNGDSGSNELELESQKGNSGLEMPDRCLKDRVHLSGEKIDHFETVRQNKDGRRLEISVTVSPLRDSQGRIIGASKVARDITEQKLKRSLLRRHLSPADRDMRARTPTLRLGPERERLTVNPGKTCNLR
jgi:hypothetical protein